MYAETEGAGIAFGGNAHATIYSGAPAVGLEVNGLVFSGKRQAHVRGIDILNGGNAPAEWARGIETSGAAPKGKPKVGIMLPGPAQGFRHNPASQTGMVIGSIDSGEAIRIQENHRFALNNAGSIYLKYNAERNQIEFYNGLTLEYAVPMDYNTSHSKGLYKVSKWPLSSNFHDDLFFLFFGKRTPPAHQQVLVASINIANSACDTHGHRVPKIRKKSFCYLRIIEDKGEKFFA